MNESEKGMVLLITLCMLGLMTSLILSMEQSLWVYTKIYRRTQAAHYHFESLEKEVLPLLKQVRKQGNLTCFGRTKDVNHAVFMLQSGQGCIVKKQAFQYQYWIDGIDFSANEFILALHSLSFPATILSIRYSLSRGLMTWRVIY